MERMHKETWTSGLIYSELITNMQILEEVSCPRGAEESAAETVWVRISTTMLAYLKPGDLVLYSKPTYGGTHHFINNFLKDIGVHSIGFNHDESFEILLTKVKKNNLLDKLKMIYIETPANPTNSLISLDIIKQFKSKMLKDYNQEVKAVVDNTYLGPIWQKPINFGADLVCYSATKFLNATVI